MEQQAKFVSFPSPANVCTRRHRVCCRNVHGLDSSMDWIGLDWILLGPTTVMYKILTAYVFQRNRPRLFLTNIDYEQSSTMSWLDLAINMQH